MFQGPTIHSSRNIKICLGIWKDIGYNRGSKPGTLSIISASSTSESNETGSSEYV